MRTLQVSELLSVWEHGLNQTVLQKPLSLISSVSDEHTFETAAMLSIGQRDTYLLQLLESLFGSNMSCFAYCPECNTHIEWENKVQDLRVSSSEKQKSEDYQLQIGDYKVGFHLPNSEDLAWLLSKSNAPGSLLLQHCINDVQYKESEFSKSELPEAILETVSMEIGELDAQADIQIALSCPDCSHQWNESFDVTRYLWEEINSWAERTLLGIHKLALAYGWTEQEILALSPVRRQLYLGLVQ